MNLQQHEPAECLFQVAVIGLSTGVVPKRIYIDDVERCRWIPWECLAGDDGVEQEPYDEKAVIWTLATMIWSMFHRAATPLENETGREIRSREYRKQFSFDIIEQLLPTGLFEVVFC
uniref:Protein kinase domain-containing protein n=1 Tax=Angiostrongylus cantonensis TaxID=6313 RepID=A0A0K0DHK4_ANGCA